MKEIIKKLQEEKGNEGTEETIAGAHVSEQEAVCMCVCVLTCPPSW